MTVSEKNADSVDQFTRELTAFVRMGILEFWRQALPDDSAVVGLLESSIKALIDIPPVSDWKTACNQLQNNIDEGIQNGTNQSDPLLRLYVDYDLTLEQLFTLGLTGEVEASYVVNLAIAELQQPDKNPRPSLHLLSAMLEALFDSSYVEVSDIAQYSLVQGQVLSMQGDAPTPLKHLTIDASLWSILCGRKTQWPQCHLIKPVEKKYQTQWVSEEVKKITPLLDTGMDSDGNNGRANGVIVRGNPNSGRRDFAAGLAESMGLQAIMIPYELWRDFTVIAVACRYANWLAVIQPEVAPGEALKLAVNHLEEPVIVLMGTDGAIEAGNFIETTLLLPTLAERQKAWNRTLENTSISRELAASALLSNTTIKTLAISAKRIALQKNEELKLSHVADARCKLGAEKLRLLAQPVFRRVTSDALVIPELVEHGLNNIILRAQKRESMWEGMGETLKATPNPGVRTLFVGESGTGKTLAASYIATGLSAPLYRVDLSAVMNKYIGESEKNLAQLLDQAAANDVVLLFDEADALFGNRSDGKENGERFANMLTNFLLTRIETHPAMVILTTNSSDRIDNAFNRRIDSIIEFPLPGYQERLHLWESHLGDRGPGKAVYQNLASLCDLAGGQIRNVVLSAAVYSTGNKITEQNLWYGLREEYSKQGRDLPGKLGYLLQPADVA